MDGNWAEPNMSVVASWTRRLDHGTRGNLTTRRLRELREMLDQERNSESPFRAGIEDEIRVLEGRAIADLPVAAVLAHAQALDDVTGAGAKSPWCSGRATAWLRWGNAAVQEWLSEPGNYLYEPHRQRTMRQILRHSTGLRGENLAKAAARLTKTAVRCLSASSHSAFAGTSGRYRVPFDALLPSGINLYGILDGAACLGGVVHMLWLDGVDLGSGASSASLDSYFGCRRIEEAMLAAVGAVMFGQCEQVLHRYLVHHHVQRDVWLSHAQVWECERRMSEISRLLAPATGR